MTYTESINKQIKPTISNMLGFTVSYILYYLFFGVAIDFTAIIILLALFIGGLFLNSFLAYRGIGLIKRIPNFWPNEKIAFWKRFEKDARLEIQTIIFLIIYSLIFYFYQLSFLPFSIIALLITGSIFSFLIKYCFEYKELFN